MIAGLPAARRAVLRALRSSAGQRLGPDVVRARVASCSFFFNLVTPERFYVFRVSSRVCCADESIIIEETWNAAAR